MDKVLRRALSKCGPVRPALSPQESASVMSKPEYWLGQITMIANLEALNTLTPSDAMKEIHRALNEMKRFYHS
jgi:hypothetical protein